MDEYEQIQRLRELWSKSIMTWAQVVLPLSAAIVAFFVTQARSKTGWDFPLLIIGWALFSLVMVYWRCVVHHIDEQIVALYPDMLRLDKTQGWETQTRYYYNNLSKRAKEHLWGKLLGQTGVAPTYDTFKEKANEKKEEHYKLLHEVWSKYGFHSVGSRGHAPQDIAVLLVTTFFLVVVLWVKCQDASAFWGLLLLLGFIPLGRCLGWWCVKPDP